MRKPRPPEVNEVEGCLMCPFISVDEDDSKDCAHPRWGETMRWGGLRPLPDKRRGSLWPPPKWCPLRRRPVLVELGRRV